MTALTRLHAFGAVADFEDWASRSRDDVDAARDSLDSAPEWSRGASVEGVIRETLSRIESELDRQENDLSYRQPYQLAQDDFDQWYGLRDALVQIALTDGPITCAAELLI